MKTSRSAGIVTLVTLIVPAACLAQRPAHGAAGPLHAAVRLDNDRVRATHIVLGPYERTPMHDVTERVVVWLTDAHLRDSLANGTIVSEEHHAGDVSWVPAQRHAGTNLSSSAIEFIAVEIKQPTGTRGR